MRLITKFNLLIRSRALWWVIAVVITVTFVWYFVPGSGEENPRGIGEGRWGGRIISPEEFRLAWRFTLGLHDFGGLTPQQQKIARRRTWQRLVLLDMARRLGLRAFDGEVRDVLREDPIFRRLGGGQAFKDFVYRQYGLPIALYERYLREQIVLSKLHEVIRTCVWLTPAELALEVRDFADDVTVQYAVLSPSNSNVATNVTRDMAREYYDAHTNQFRIPRRISVCYVEFPFSNYLGDVQLSETDIQQYYEEHRDVFSERGTNGATATWPLDVVRTHVVERLTFERAREKAREKAMEFVVAIVGGRYQKGIPPEEAAHQCKVSVQTTRFFSASESLEEPDAGPEFYRVAFDLDPSRPPHHVSDVVTGERAAYVLWAGTSLASRLPPFEEVAERALALAQTNAERRAFQNRAQEIRESVREALAQGKSFADALRPFGLGVATTAPFSVYQALGAFDDDRSNAIPHALSLASAVVRTEQGQVAELAEEENVFLLPFVAKRQPGSSDIRDSVRLDRHLRLERFLTSLAAGAWADHWLASSAFEDFHPVSDKLTESVPEEESARTSLD